jgi:hypothetical protein
VPHQRVKTVEHVWQKEVAIAGNSAILLRIRFHLPLRQKMQTNAPSLGRITLIYIAFYLGMAMLLNLIVWAAAYFAGFVLEASSFGWLPLIIGAMMTGQHYGAKTGGKPPQSFSWIAGLVFMLVSVVISMAILYVMALVFKVDVAAGIGQLRAEVGNQAGLVAGIIGGLLLFIWVLQRFAFSTGAGQGAKQAARRAK